MFQLIATDVDRITEVRNERLCRGQIEQIGGETIIVVQTRNRPRKKFTASIPDLSGFGIPTDEELLIARDTAQCTLAKPGEHRAVAAENSGVREMTIEKRSSHSLSGEAR
jgi:hypothetical protein